MVLILTLMSLNVYGVEIFRFSGTVEGNVLDNTIIGEVDSCGNLICQTEFDENFSNCPSDCEEDEITPFFDMQLIDFDLTGISDDSYSNGWMFRFNITFYYPDATRFEIKLEDFVSGNNTISVSENAIMTYKNSSGTMKDFDITNTFQEPAYEFVDSIYDISDEVGIQSIVDVKIKLPIDTVPGSYSAHYWGGIW